MSYAFAAAGTGGHVYPALAVADALIAAGVSRSDIVFLGGDRIEQRLVPAAGYDLVTVDVRGLVRRRIVVNLTLPRTVFRAAAVMRREMTDRKVRAVAVFGGYVSVPAALAARRLGLGLLVHEQNAIPGLANRLISGRADATFVAFPETARRLAAATTIGNPLRGSLTEFERSKLRPRAEERYDLPEAVPVLGVLGGSQGALLLNDLTARFAADAEAGSVAIVHLAGSVHQPTVAPLAEASPQAWRVLGFEEDMDYFYAAADVVLCRAGALTISELCVTGTPSVIVPYAAGTGGHQAANAIDLEAAGGAIVLTEAEADRVPMEVQELLADQSRRSAMAAAAIGLARPNAATIMAEALMESGDE